MSINMEAFAKRLKELREIHNLTQSAVAKILNMKQQSYLRYELDTSEPTLDTLVKIALFFKISTDYLLGLED